VVSISADLKELGVPPGGDSGRGRFAEAAKATGDLTDPAPAALAAMRQQIRAIEPKAAMAGRGGWRRAIARART
jgi:hypothetical protein